MLFIGTEKYPGRTAFRTSMPMEGYQRLYSKPYELLLISEFSFRVIRSDRFVISSSTLTVDEYVDREKNVGHSDTRCEKEDSWQFMTSKLVMNPEYAGSKFLRFSRYAFRHKES